MHSPWRRRRRNARPPARFAMHSAISCSCSTGSRAIGRSPRTLTPPSAAACTFCRRGLGVYLRASCPGPGVIVFTADAAVQFRRLLHAHFTGEPVTPATGSLSVAHSARRGHYLSSRCGEHSAAQLRPAVNRGHSGNTGTLQRSHTVRLWARINATTLEYTFWYIYYLDIIIM